MSENRATFPHSYRCAIEKPAGQGRLRHSIRPGAGLPRGRPEQENPRYIQVLQKKGFCSTFFWPFSRRCGILKDIMTKGWRFVKNVTIPVPAPAAALLDELEFPQQLIVNLRQETFEAYLREREARIGSR